MKKNIILILVIVGCAGLFAYTPPAAAQQTVEERLAPCRGISDIAAQAMTQRQNGVRVEELLTRVESLGYNEDMMVLLRQMVVVAYEIPLALGSERDSIPLIVSEYANIWWNFCAERLSAETPQP